MERKVIIYNDESCDMKKIEVNGKVISEGNYWDYSDFDGALKNIFQELKINISIKKYKYE